MSDRIVKITEELIKFRDEREWKQFHTPKDLAISLSIESSELLECFQWKTEQDVAEMLETSFLEDVKDEIANVASYLLLLCEATGIDLIDAMEHKIIKNNLKYPVEKSKGLSTKYNKL